MTVINVLCFNKSTALHQPRPSAERGCRKMWTAGTGRLPKTEHRIFACHYHFLPPPRPDESIAMLINRILNMLEGQLPAMRPVRCAAMAENAFRYYRGANALFYEDLSKATGFPDGPPVWLSGDLHLENFGAFRGENRLVYFDLNDFDESVLGPATWEVVRLATSIFVAFDSLGIEEAQAKRLAERYLRGYSNHLASGKATYIEPQTADGIICDFLTKASHSRRGKKLLKKRTKRVNHRLVMETDHPGHAPLDGFRKRELMHFLTEWIIHGSDGPYNYSVEDVAFRIAGTGSVGWARYMFLLRSLIDDDEYVLVDMKSAQPSSLVPFVQLAQPAWESEAHRIVAVQRRMQNIPPALLSPVLLAGEPYILQELQPVKDSIDFKMLKNRYRDMCNVVDCMAALTASAQLRSSGRQGSAITDDLIAFANRGHWAEEVIEYAREYAQQVKQDFALYRKEWSAGSFRQLEKPAGE